MKQVYTENGKTFWRFKVSYGSESKKTRVFRKKSGLVFKDETEAEAFHQKLIREAAMASARREHQGFTWLQLVEKWDSHLAGNPSQKWSDSTRRDIYARLRNYTKPMHQKFSSKLAQVDVEECLEVAEIYGASFKVRRAILRSIDTVYKWAMNKRYILNAEHSICRDVVLEPKSKDSLGEKEPLILTKEEIKILLRTAKEVNHPWYPIWFFALYTGMRAGEIEALRKQKIDLVSPEEARTLDKKPDGVIKDYGKIRVQKSWNKTLNKNGPTKARWWRTVPVNSQMYWFLQEYLQSDFGSDEDGSRVFPLFSELRRSEQAKVIRDFCKTQGLKEITFHTFRACFATQMFQAGMDIATVMKIGGWKHIKTLMIYVRLAGVDEAGKTQALNFGDFKRQESFSDENSSNVISLFGS